MIYLALAKRFAPYALIAVLCLTIWAQHINNKRYQLNLSICQSNITQIKAQYEIAQQKQALENQQKLAEGERLGMAIEADNAKRLDAIQKAPVPTQCEAAIQWAIGQAKTL